MEKPRSPAELVTLKELAVSSADGTAAPVAVLERKGILTQAEVRKRSCDSRRCL